MVTRFVSALLLVALAGGSRADGVPEDLSFIKALIEPYASCVLGELSCSSDCSSVRACLGNGIYVDVQECPPDTLCDRSSATCSPNILECNSFSCVGNVGGLFPNPFDCHSYFECIDPITPLDQGFYFECQAPLHNNGFDPSSGLCDLPPYHRVCQEGPVPKCTTPMQSGALVENPNIYYVCVSISGGLRPLLARCDEQNQVFENGHCVERSNVSTTTSGSVTTTFETTTNGRCDYPESTHPDPDDCRGYYLCTPDGILVHFRCREGYHYDVLKKTCVIGWCSNN